MSSPYEFATDAERIAAARAVALGIEEGRIEFSRLCISAERYYIHSSPPMLTALPLSD